MAQALQASVSFDEYLAGERDVDSRSEYTGGEVYAMAGTSERHNTIAGDFVEVLSQSTRRTDLKDMLNYIQTNINLFKHITQKATR